tara:strand:- start:19577 stop:20623 length:1047 start_codon:yes stop_codon:yes gene_type:complete
MYAAVIEGYGTEPLKIIKDQAESSPSADQVLVEVFAASLNPIDLMKKEGYGKALFEKQRNTIFPWTLGSDFSGKIISIGKNVTRLSPGDEVWGCSSNANSGTFSQYVCINQSEVDLKPKNLNFIEAASLPYVALTTWSAIVRWGGLNPNNIKEKKVFIQGGSGGVGTYAIQFFKNLNCTIATTCSKRNFDLVKSLGADTVINYREDKIEEILSNYDLVYDLLGDLGNQNEIENCFKILKQDLNSNYISLNHSFIRNIDNKGLILGLPKSIIERNNLRKKYSPVKVHWSIYRPSLSALIQLRNQVENKEIKPIVNSIFPINDINKAFNLLASKNKSGKIVININSHDLP